MKYILKGNNDFSSPMDTILRNRGVTWDLFNLDINTLEDYNHYDNIDLAVETLIKHINNNSKIIVVGDCDVDGITSSTILLDYINKTFNYKNIILKIHKEKKHGLSDDIEIDEDVRLIILPDASSNDYEQHSYYKSKGIDIIVLDHHPADKISENAVVINNRLSEKVKTKELSGAGVVYMFLKALDDYLFQELADNYLDLVSIGNVGDVIDLKEPCTRYLVKKGIENINNTFLKALIDTYSFELDNKYNINKIGWVICPKLNGTIRSGEFSLKEKLYQAFLSDNYEFCLEVAKQCKNAKATQDNSIKTALPKIEKTVSLKPEDRCVFIEVDDKLQSEHIGLVANKLQEKYGVNAVLFKKINNEEYGGSARGNSNLTESFKDDIKNSGLFTFTEGQPNAFGIGFKKENINTIKQYVNELYKDKEVISGKTYVVDFIIEEKDIDYNILNEIAQYEDEWGNKLDEPLICFKDLNVYLDENNIKGTKSKNLVFEINGVKFIKKYLTNIIKDKVLEENYINLNCIGKCTNNIYNNNSYLQIEIVDLEIQ